jgi:hypothetical protein
LFRINICYLITLVKYLLFNMTTTFNDLVITGRLYYSGSATSPTITITAAPTPLAVGSMVNGAGGYNNTGDATTSGTVSG